MSKELDGIKKQLRKAGFTLWDINLVLNLTVTGEKKCDFCDGAGVVPIGVNEIPCPKCNGTKEISETKTLADLIKEWLEP